MKLTQAPPFTPRRCWPLPPLLPESPAGRPMAAWEIAHEAALPRDTPMAKSLLPWRPVKVVPLASAVTALLAEACALSYEPGDTIEPCLKRAGFRDVERFNWPPSNYSASERSTASDASRPVRALAFCDDWRIFLAFRGTQSPEDWTYNLNIWPCGHPKRHMGFQRAWSELAPQVSAWLEPRLEAGRVLYLAGHSLGGAIATIAAFELASRAPIGGVVTLGSPRVGGRVFAKEYAKQPAAPSADGSGQTLPVVTLRYQHGIDFVVRAFPPPPLCVHVIPAIPLPPHQVGQAETSNDSAGGATHTLSPEYSEQMPSVYRPPTFKEHLVSNVGLLISSFWRFPLSFLLVPMLYGFGAHTYQGVIHHRRAIYATLLSPGKLLKEDWLNRPAKPTETVR